MATQIAATPIIKDKKMIAQIVKEVNKKPSEKSKIASQKLEAKFSSMSIRIWIIMNINKPINSVFIFKAGTSEKIKKESKSKKSLETIMKQAEYFDRHVGKRWNL